MLTLEQRSDLAYLTGQASQRVWCRVPDAARSAHPEYGSVGRFDFTRWIAGCVHHLAAYQMLDSQLFAAIAEIAFSLQNYWSGFAGELMDTAVLR